MTEGMTTDRYSDDGPADAPHAYATLEGQACSCAARYYGGDCEHTYDPLDDLLGSYDAAVNAARVEREAADAMVGEDLRPAEYLR